MTEHYRDPAEGAIRCPVRGYQLPLLSCLKCRKFPCPVVSGEMVRVLETSAFVDHEFMGFALRRIRMLIFKKANGTLVEAPANFNVDNPDLRLLEDVSEVLVVGKSLVKQVKLVPKPKEEIAKVRQSRVSKKNA